ITNLGAETGGETSVGYRAMQNRSSSGVALGWSALGGGGTGLQNTALGSEAYYKDSTGGASTAVGTRALYNNTVGFGLCAIGHRAMADSTSGAVGTTVGASSQESITTGTTCTSAGAFSMQKNTTGGANDALGASSLRFNLSGSYNTAAGFEAAQGVSGQSINRNVVLGHRAGHLLQANYNVMAGCRAGDGLSSGAYNIAIGYDCDLPLATGSYQLNIGNAIFANLTTLNVGIGQMTPSGNLHVTGNLRIEDDLCMAGDLIPAANASVDLGSSNLAWRQIHTEELIIISDRRRKMDIKPLSLGEAELLALQPVSYRFRQGDRSQRMGLIAQEVQTVIPDVVTAENPGGPIGVRYESLVPLMASALKQRWSHSRQLEKEILLMEAQVARLKREMAAGLNTSPPELRP
ncbi:MAG: tail fiber domain-containing protein, partial [Planctomycetes bacterium]|nr:tail fiber domain-containing protein [Planctomycetota bacterium]